MSVLGIISWEDEAFIAEVLSLRRSPDASYLREKLGLAKSSRRSELIEWIYQAK
jgi:hypothetical protein